MLLTRRNQSMLLLALAVLCAAPLVYLYLTASTSHVEKTIGDAMISVSTSPDRVLFPGQCVVVSWQTEHIQAVYLDEQGRVGVGTQERCLVGAAPELRVDIANEPTWVFQPPVEQLYRNPLVLALLAGLITAVSVAAYRLLGVPGLLMVLMVVLFGPMLRSLANLHHDFIDHTMFASIARDSGNFNALPPQFLYHLSAIVISSVIPALNLENAGFLLVLAAYVLCSIAVYMLLYRLSGKPSRSLKTDLLLACVTLAIMLAGPVSFISDRFNPTPSLIEFNAYHSPTIGLLKPIAVALFLCILKLLAEPQRHARRNTIILAVLTILATLAKPSYTVAIVPAIALVLAYSFIRPLSIHRIAIIAGILLPAALVLGWQYLFLYGPQQQSAVYNSAQPARIVFAPLEYYLTWQKTPWYRLIPDFILSALFPAAVYLAYFRQARRDTALNLAWLAFLIGAALGYFFIERPNESHGNLTWSGQITLFILFAVSAAFLLKQYDWSAGRFRLDGRFALCAALFAAHVVNHLALLIT